MIYETMAVIRKADDARLVIRKEDFDPEKFIDANAEVPGKAPEAPVDLGKTSPEPGPGAVEEAQEKATEGEGRGDAQEGTDTPSDPWAERRAQIGAMGPDGLQGLCADYGVDYLNPEQAVADIMAYETAE